MELYIEKAFIDDLYLDMDLDNPSIAQKILLNIFKNYGEVDKYMDVVINTPKDLETLKSSNILIAYLYSYFPPLSVKSIKEHFFNASRYNQTLVFTHKHNDWFNDAEKKGALCFSFDDYENKIKKIIENNHWKLHFIFEKFSGWHLLGSLSELPCNEVIIHDSYIISDGTGQRIDDNLIPLLKTILNKSSNKITTRILTKEFKARPDTPQKRKEKAKKVHHRIMNNLNNKNVDVYIISKDSNSFNNVDLHGRTITSNFFHVSSPKGFNLLPFKTNNESIEVSSIFEKSTYMVIKAERSLYAKILKKLNKPETLNFKTYPDLCVK